MPGQSPPAIPPGLPFDAFVAALRVSMRGPLPGVEAHERMAPIPRPGWRPGIVPEGARPAGGLLLLYPLDARPHLLLTLRSRHLPSHRGQVSLPGGMVEPGESPRFAALREAHEEAGVDPALVEVLGELTALYIPVSGFTLHPFVAVAATRPSFRAEPGEVERILEVPLDRLRDPVCMGYSVRMLLGESRKVRYFDVAGEKVWGATSMILSEFLCLIGSPPPERTDG